MSYGASESENSFFWLPKNIKATNGNSFIRIKYDHFKWPRDLIFNVNPFHIRTYVLMC
ncbi:hypothetical protein KPC190_00729 [Klebsiella pneumoniae]|nr:hypothetical protein [Klebsiella pneumoniae]MCB8863354.1 hypothetical protein [Klebsiella pneumoniae]